MRNQQYHERARGEWRRDSNVDLPSRKDEQTWPHNLTPPRALPGMPQAMSGSVPIPDPTTLTNQLVSSAILAVREVLEAKIQDLTRLEPRMFERIEALKELKATTCNSCTPRSLF